MGAEGAEGDPSPVKEAVEGVPFLEAEGVPCPVKVEGVEEIGRAHV